MDNPKSNEFASPENTLSKDLEREEGQEGDSMAGIWMEFRMGLSIQKRDEMHWDIGASEVKEDWSPDDKAGRPSGSSPRG